MSAPYCPLRLHARYSVHLRFLALALCLVLASLHIFGEPVNPQRVRKTYARFGVGLEDAAVQEDAWRRSAPLRMRIRPTKSSAFFI